ncbi:MAG TPA: lysoplasmalogenase [Anaerolineae bacterium]|nr:lysoplasmalogenase [Anaerolineae bacterium]
MSIAILVLLVGLSGGLAIRAEYCGSRQSIYIFKLLTMALILLIALLGQVAAPFYKALVIAGLLASMVGDILLALPSDRFVAGLGAFLLAHLFYIAAFASEVKAPVGWPFIPLIVYGASVYTFLASSLDKLKLPLLIYITVILVMIGFAWERWIGGYYSGAWLAFSGAILFGISDSVLAINRFRKKFKLACALILITYFAAQCLIAGSVGGLF